MRAAGLEPLEAYSGSGRPWRCRHTPCGREVAPTYSNIRGGQGGCGHCAGRIIDPADAELVMRAAGLEPLEAYPGAMKRWRCRHVPCQREVTPTYSNVRTGGSGCRFCRRIGTVVSAADAEAQLRAAGMEPLEPYYGLDSGWRARCLTCGTEGAPRLTNIRRGQGGCRPCGRRKADIAIRTPAEQAIAAMRAANLEPLEDFRNSGTPWRCRCVLCGSTVTPRLRKPACRICANKARGAAQRHNSAEAVARMRVAVNDG